MRILDSRRPLQAHLSLGSVGLLLVGAVLGLPRFHAQPAAAPPALAIQAEPAPEAARPLVVAQAPVAPQPEPPPRLKGAVPVAGVVRDGAGQPVAGARLSATIMGQEIHFYNGELQLFGDPRRPDTATGPDGRYKLPAALFRDPQEPDEERRFGVFVWHKRGYARKSADELAESPDLTLEPWGRVEGTVTVLGKPLADLPIRFTLDATDQHSMFYDYYEYQARTDAQGQFAVDRVPAGLALAATGTSSLKDAGPYGILHSPSVLIQSGATLRLDIGGTGRPVEGKLLVREGIPVALAGGSLLLQTNLPPEPPEPSAEVMKRMTRDQRFRSHFEPYRSPEGLARRLARQYYPVQIRPDGSFRAAEVEPGTYTLSFRNEGQPKGRLGTREVVVPPIPGGRTDAPLDLGTVIITPTNPGA